MQILHPSLLKIVVLIGAHRRGFSDDPANTPTSSVQDVLTSRSQEEPMDHNMIETVYRNIDASAFILHMMSEWSSNLQRHLGGDMERGQGILDQTCTRKKESSQSLLKKATMQTTLVVYKCWTQQTREHLYITER